MTRAEVLAAMKQDRANLLAALEGMSEQAMTTIPAAGEWTVKDLLGHMAMWKQVAVKFIAEYRQAGIPQSLGLENGAATDAYNQRGAALRRDWPLARVREELDAAHRELVAAVESLGDADLVAPLGGPWEGKTTLEHLIAINSYTHDPEHIQQIKETRDRTAKRGV